MNLGWGLKQFLTLFTVILLLVVFSFLAFYYLRASENRFLGNQKNFKIETSSMVDGLGLFLVDEEKFMDVLDRLGFLDENSEITSIEAVIADQRQDFSTTNWLLNEQSVYVASSGYEIDDERLILKVHMDEEQLIDNPTPAASPSYVFNSKLLEVLCSYSATNQNKTKTSATLRDVCRPEFFETEYFLVNKK